MLSIREQCERDWHRLNGYYKGAESAGSYAVSRATGDGAVGRRSVPPLDCGSVSAGTEPRRERPAPRPGSVTPRAAQGSFTSRFRLSGSQREMRAAACQIASRRAARSRTRDGVISSGRTSRNRAGMRRRIACVSGCLRVRWCHVCDGHRWRQGCPVQAVPGTGPCAPPEPREKHDRGRGDRVCRKQAARTGAATRQALPCESSLTPAF